MAVSDFQINSRIRSVLARYWLDLQKARFGSFRGIVRFTGRLVFLHSAHSANPGFSLLENLEKEIRRITGVKRIHFDLENWRRNATGEWECTDSMSHKSGGLAGKEQAKMTLEPVSDQEATGEGSGSES